MTEAPRTTSAGLWRYGKEFSKAGDLVHQEAHSRLSAPAYYLLGHSIELLLKAFLLGRGIPLKDLKRKRFGHNLDALFERARYHQLGRVIHLTRVDHGVIHLLNIEYSIKRFEYIRTGPTYIPEWSLLVALSHKLASGLEEFCKSAPDP